MSRVSLYKKAYRGACALGRPFGGLRPTRVYTWLAARAYPPAFGPVPEDAVIRETRFGYRLLVNPFYHIDRSILQFGCYDSRLHAFIERHVQPGQICFDVGANIGDVSIHLAQRVGAGGKVHAFEPNPEMAARLVANVGANGFDSRVDVQVRAISDRTGSVTFHAVATNQPNHGVSSIVDDSSSGGQVEVIVPTVSLDDFVQGAGIRRIDLMKIDIQGAEPLLLAGGRKTLREMKPDLLIEVAPAELGRGGSGPVSLLATLEELGYHLFTWRGADFSEEIHSANVSDRFSAENVFCTSRTGALV